MTPQRSGLPSPYYSDDAVTLYHADCRDVLPCLSGPAVLVTDPPYPNNAGHFTDAVAVAEEVIGNWAYDALVFWTELEQPPIKRTPLVAVHVWHRTNVNGRPYEPIYHFAADGAKRRSEVIRHAAVFDGAGPGCNEYLGHPTQKPVALMQRLVEKLPEGTVCDPFMGSGSTIRAAKNLGRHAVGIEVDERYCEIAARRMAQDVLDFGVAA